MTNIIMFKAILVCSILSVSLLGYTEAQTPLSNATTVSAVLSPAESRLYEVSVPQDHQLLVSLTILDGSCANTRVRDGGVLPLSSNARAQQLPYVGTTSTAVSACSINGADKWYFEIVNSQCGTLQSSFQFTVTVVPRPCALPMNGNSSIVERVYADEEWAFYSVSVPANTEVRFTVESLVATTTCDLYRLYTRLGDRPNDTTYDTLVSGLSDQKLMEYRSACAASGTLYVAMRENCPYGVGKFSAYSLRIESYTRECAPSISGPFPNNMTWSVRPLKMTYFKFSPASLNLNQNGSVLFTVRPLPSSAFQTVALFSKLNDYPTSDVYDFRSTNPGYAAISYTACKVPTSGDLFLGVRNQASSYSLTLDFEIVTTIMPINCDEPMVTGQLYRGYVSTWYFQRYSVAFGTASKMALSFCKRPESAVNSVALAVRWNSSPANDTAYDWRDTDSPTCATYYYDSCATGQTSPRSGTLYASVRAAGSSSSNSVLDYEGSVFLDPRPCVQVVPTGGAVFEESIISNTMVYFYSWEATAGARITIDIVSSNSVSFFYRFGALPTPSDYEVLSSSFPYNFTASSTGTHYFRIASPMPGISIRTPVLASVRFYPPESRPTFPPTAASTPTPSSTPKPSGSTPKSPGSSSSTGAGAKLVWSLALWMTCAAVFLLFHP